ncbi:MAG: hypothetical protein DRH26_13195 [Deltaproteobacteria bacterium]|nr:MAG: hypothetical protein DRH26_13195 [Deltaproteobacteria bacterium]
MIKKKLVKKTEIKKDITQKKTSKVPIEGVDYSKVTGTICPSCRMPGAFVRNTLPWEDGLRVRYHTCRRCGTNFKSIELL